MVTPYFVVIICSFKYMDKTKLAKIKYNLRLTLKTKKERKKTEYEK